MKILFAISNENISANIKKQYQNDFKGMLVTKNVYYFNAIIKELQNDKTYDVIVISEDLEPFANNNYDVIDKFLISKLSNIREESKKIDGTNIPIIFIMTDRHTAGDNLLCRLYEIQIYNALYGENRNLKQVCELIAKPRDKERAKVEYKIVNDKQQEERDDNVKEVEIRNIIAHYKKLGKNEEKYVDSFNNIASQYNDAQLKVIIKFLPLNVKAVLEEQSPKYQELMTFAQNNRKSTPIPKQIGKIKEQEKKLEQKSDVVLEQLSDIKSDSQIIIPKSINSKVAKHIGRGRPKIKPIEQEIDEEDNIEELIMPGIDETDDLADTIEDINEIKNENSISEVEDIQPVKRGRGRPKKVKSDDEDLLPKVPKKRGRPKKNQPIETAEKENVEDESVTNLFDMAEIEDEGDKEIDEKDSFIISGFDEEAEDEKKIEESKQDKNIQYNNISFFDTEETKGKNNLKENSYDSGLIKAEKNDYQYENIEHLISRDRKIVSFVGTSKNGTSFIVNNVAQILSEMGINTAILDMTKNKNSYYIYTQNDENLRQRAHTSLEKLLAGIVEGIVVKKNLTVFTSTPTDSRVFEEADIILKNLVQNYSLVLIDCDFKTPLGYFDNSQEIYLVQSMDILTIQPLTAFLRELKTRNILKQEKIKVIVNKAEKIKGLNEKAIVGGIAYYNDPSMSFMTELFDKNSVQMCIIPFNLQVYTKYLAGLVEPDVSISGYPKQFVGRLKELANMIFPLISSGNKSSYVPPSLNKFGNMQFGRN